MKYHILILLSCLTSSLIAQQKLRVVASASMIQDIASQVIGNNHNIEVIVPIGGDPHIHEPTPSNVRLVAGADLILINGLTFEGWINELIHNSGTKGAVVTVSEGIDVLTSQAYHNSADPHAWMDVSNAVIYARNIRDAIKKLDPDKGTLYDDNYARYEQELLNLDTEIKAAIETIPPAKRVLITSHDAFQYYGRRYGIRLEAIMGVSTEAEAQTADIVRVSRAIRESQVPAIFIESTINPKMVQQLAKDNEVNIGGKLYADSLGDKDSPAATYIGMLRYNTHTIVSALRGEISNTTSHSDHSAGDTNWSLLAVISAVLIIGTIAAVYKLNQ